MALLLALSWSGGGARADAITAPPAPTAAPAASNTATPAASGPRCTIAMIVEDIGSNATYLGRLRFLAPEAPPPGQAPVCPAGAAQATARRMLDICKQHASNPYNCVYGDTDHMFDITTDIVDSSAIDSQCASYNAKYIAIACQPGNAEDVCNIGCGDSTADALAAARKKCQANHDGECVVTNVAPVQAP